MTFRSIHGWLALLALVGACGRVTPPPGETVIITRAIDGDTVCSETTCYRIWGVDAPDPGRREDCPEARKVYRAGKLFLDDFLVGYRATITRTYGKSWDRPVVSISSNGEDLGKLLLRRGFVKEWKHDERNRKIGERPKWCS